jgi:hypothetical protein
MYMGNIKFYSVPFQTVDIQNQEHVLEPDVNHLGQNMYPECIRNYSVYFTAI